VSAMRSAAITVLRPHGPGAVRVLIYRLCDGRERVQSTAAIHLNGSVAADFQENLGHGCDLPSSDALPTACEIGDFELKMGRGPGI
jgi:hypothetical protein